MQILLVDREPAMIRAWRAAFEDRDDVEVVEGDYFARPAAARIPSFDQIHAIHRVLRTA
jgi:hypothetical protein